MADWSQLPTDLVLLIAEHLKTRFDILRLRSICSSWRSSVTPKLYAPLPSYLPWLTHGIWHSTFICITTNTFYLIKFPATATACWLAKIRHGGKGVKTALLNPLSNSELKSKSPIVLDLTKFQVFELGHEYIGQHAYMGQIGFLSHCKQKMVLLRLSSTDTDSDDFIMLGYFGSLLSGLAVQRSGEKDWTVIKDVNNVQDIISFNGKFYAIDGEGRTVAIDRSLNVSFLERVGSGSLDSHVFLVKSVDNLLAVEMFFLPSSNTDDNVCGFRALRMNEEEEKWEMESLKERILFLNLHQSFSAPASEFGWGKGNLVFYPKHLFNSPPYDEYEVVCVYDLVTGTVSTLDNCPLFRNLFWPPPQWVISSTQVVSNSAHFVTSAKKLKTSETNLAISTTANLSKRVAYSAAGKEQLFV